MSADKKPLFYFLEEKEESGLKSESRKTRGMKLAINEWR